MNKAKSRGSMPLSIWPDLILFIGMFVFARAAYR